MLVQAGKERQYFAMDTLTHALSGMLLARATARTKAKIPQLPLHVRMWCGFLAAAFPDADFVTRYFGSLSYLEYHRGVTHSILMLPLWALLLSFIFFLLWRRRYRWQLFVGISAMSVLIHILGDVITAYGTMVFAPLTDWRFSIPTTFIIDLYFSGIILLALVIAWIRKSQAQRIAVVGLITLVTYIGIQGYWHQQATYIAKQKAEQMGLAQENVSVIPQPLSPRYWKLILEAEQQYHIAYLNLDVNAVNGVVDEDNFWSRLKSLYRPAEQLQWETAYQYGQGEETRKLAQAAWSIPVLNVLQRFMQYPSLVDLETRAEGLCAWFVDQRFVLRGLRAPFRFGACRKAEGTWLAYRYFEDGIVPLL